MSAKICPQCAAEYELNQKYCTNDGAVLRLVGATESLEGRIIGGREILRRLGEGGMGEVYLAETVRTKRKDAVKVMRADIARSPDAVSRFNREATNASRINHPNVAIIYDVGDTDDGMPYMAMEYVDGPSLAQLIEGAAPMAPLRVARMVRQIAAALQAAHDMGVVHRDLKPANIMIAPKPEPDTVKLVDFGISKVPEAAEQQVTTSGVSIGSPAYMSPEQVAGEQLDTRSDIYSLGLVAFDLLTGRLPFAATDGPGLMFARVTGPAMSLGQAAPTVRWGQELERVMARVLARNAGDRYPTAMAFADDFQAAVGRMPVAGGDDTTIVYQSTAPITPTVRRPQQARFRAALGTASAVGGLALVAWLATRDRPTTPASMPESTSGAAPNAPPPSGAGRPDDGRGGGPTTDPKSARPTSPAVTPAPPSARADRENAGRSTAPPARNATGLTVRITNLAAPLRARVDSVVRVVPGVVTVASTTAAADVTLQTDANGRLVVFDRDGVARGTPLEPTAVVTVLPGLIRHRLAMAELAALDAGGGAGDVRFEFTNAKRDFAVGEQLRWRVRSQRGGYLTIIDIGPMGTATVLNPSDVSDVIQVGAGEEVLVPRATMVPFSASLPAGVGRVRAIITDAPLQLDRTSPLLIDANGPRLAARIRSEVLRVANATGGQWSTVVLEYSVRP